MLYLLNRSSFVGSNAKKDLYLFLCVSLVLIICCNQPVKAGVIVDTYDVGGGLHGADNAAVASVINDGFFGTSAVRGAVKFNITGSDYQLSSIKLPISFQGTEPNNYLKVSVARDSFGIPGDILEVLSDGQNIWPGFANPFSVSTELISVSKPLLSSGQGYWIIIEPTSTLPMSFTNVDYIWYASASGPYSDSIQEQAFNTGLPSNWSAGNFYSVRAAFRVEGTAVPEPASMAVLGVGALALLMKRTRSRKIKRLVLK
jgi:hypothetical protein